MQNNAGKPALSAFIITKNECRNIDDCIASLGFAAEIVVVDDFSDDGTAERCAELGCRVISRRFTSFSDQKQFAMEATSHEWVLELDADERVSPAMREAICALGPADLATMAGFAFRRRTRFWGKWIRHSALYPDYKLRLYHKGRGVWKAARVHEHFIPHGTVRRIPQDILHCQDLDLRTYALRTMRYAELSAEDLFERGRRSRWYDFLRPVHMIFLRYVIRLGFLDGVQGAAIAAMGGFGTFYKYFRLFELDREHRDSSGVGRRRS